MQERVLLNHQRIARAVARTDTQLQEQLSKASSSLHDVDKAEGIQREAAGASGKSETNRDLAVMAASDAPKVGRCPARLHSYFISIPSITVRYFSRSSLPFVTQTNHWVT